MTWTNLSFSSGAILTASNMNALQTNFSAVASGTSGAPDLASINKAWVVFSANGHIMNSENVSSVTRTQLGEYRITWGKAFTASYGVTFGDVTTADGSDISVRGFRGFPSAAANITVTYVAFNPSANAKEDVMGTIAAWEV